ncbi:MAG: LysE family translocator [Alphaproteobacteria bacterium]|nr:LysE family translocator [Alphaproteobacteria bacterium]
MSVETWLAFVIACMVLTLIPGPCVLLLIGQSLTRGVKAAFSSIIGVLIGDIVLIILSLFGVGAILAASAELFQMVKWAGVAYMAYLGFCSLRDANKTSITAINDNHIADISQSFRAGFLSAILNPKGVIFYVAFLAQFMNPAANMVAQILILVVTSTIVVGVILAAYVLAAARAKKIFQSQKARRNMNYTSGGFFLGGSVLMATTG